MKLNTNRIINSNDNKKLIYQKTEEQQTNLTELPIESSNYSQVEQNQQNEVLLSPNPQDNNLSNHSKSLSTSNSENIYGETSCKDFLEDILSSLSTPTYDGFFNESFEIIEDDNNQSLIFQNKLISLIKSIQDFHNCFNLCKLDEDFIVNASISQDIDILHNSTTTSTTSTTNTILDKNKFNNLSIVTSSTNSRLSYFRENNISQSIQQQSLDDLLINFNQNILNLLSNVNY